MGCELQRGYRESNVVDVHDFDPVASRFQAGRAISVETVQDWLGVVGPFLAESGIA